jgi:TIR domain
VSVHDVFVSYSKHDRERIERLVRALENRGWTVYWDRKILAGDAWHTQIAAELAASRCVVVAWSAHSVTSNWVRDEATQAHERGVLVPVTIDPVAIPLGFGQVHTIAVMNATGELDADGVEQLAASVRRYAGEPGAAASGPQPLRAPVAAPEPPQPQRRRASDAAVRPRRSIGARVSRAALLVVLPVLAVFSVAAFAFAIADAAMAWMFVVIGAAAAALVYWRLGRARIDASRASPALLTATLLPAATIVAAVAVLFFGPVALRLPYALLAGLVGGGLAASAVTRWWTVRDQPTPKVAGYTAAGALVWFAVALVFSTAIEGEVASYFANQTTFTGLFEFSRPFLHAAFVKDLRTRTGDVDIFWWLAAFAMAAGVVHALRAGLEHERDAGAAR